MNHSATNVPADVSAGRIGIVMARWKMMRAAILGTSRLSCVHVHIGDPLRRKDVAGGQGQDDDWLIATTLESRHSGGDGMSPTSKLSGVIPIEAVTIVPVHLKGYELEKW